MGEVWIKESTLTAIGDAVRTKTGASGLLAPGDMITALDGIKSSGVYLFSKKGMGSDVTETMNFGAKELVTSNATIPEVEIEWGIDAPSYNNDTGVWELPNSIISTIVNTDTNIPTNADDISIRILAREYGVFIRLTSEPNVWYVVDEVSVDTMNASGTCTKDMVYNLKYEAPIGDVIGYAVADDLAKYPDGGWKNGYYWECVGGNVKIIEFKTRPDTYPTTDTIRYAAEGMTWAEWVDSDYNNGDITISGTQVLCNNGTLRVLNGSNVLSSDIIIAGQVYVHAIPTISGGEN